MLGERIKKIRKTLGYTQERFAELMFAPRSTIANYETNRVIPSDLFISRLCNTFNVNEKWLQAGEGDMLFAKSEDEQFTDLVTEIMMNETGIIKDIMIQVAQLDEDELTVILALLKTMNEKKASH